MKFYMPLCTKLRNTFWEGRSTYLKKLWTDLDEIARVEILLREGIFLRVEVKETTYERT